MFSDLTAQQVRQMLIYNPGNGLLFWRRRADYPKSWNARFAGKQAGNVTDHGYMRVRLNKRSYRAHRLAWLYVYGEWPDGEIDHINGDTLDNRIENLRVASHAENGRNRGANKNNTSGFKGVYWNRLAGKWVAQTKVNRQQIYLGTYETPEDAHAAYCRAVDVLHGDFANYGDRCA